MKLLTFLSGRFSKWSNEEYDNLNKMSAYVSKIATEAKAISLNIQ